MEAESYPTIKEDVRVQRSKAKILIAASTLLIEKGLSGFNVDAIVAKSGVAKTTLYRHWMNREALLNDTIAYYYQADDTKLPDTGSLRGDLLTYLLSGAKMVQEQKSNPQPPTLAGLIDAAGRDSGVADLCLQILNLTLTYVHPLFYRAQARGEIAADHDVDTLAKIVLGAVYFDQTLNLDTDPKFIEKVVDTVLQGIVVS